MATAPLEAGHNLTTPRHWFRRRWLVITTICFGLLIAAEVVFRDRSLAVMALPDGRRFTIHKLSYGTHHQYWPLPSPLTSAENYVNLWLSRIGRRIEVGYVGGGGFRNSTSSVGVSHTFDWSHKNPECDPEWIVLTDRHGWRTSVSTQRLFNSPPTPAIPGVPVTPLWIDAAMPAASPELQFQLLNSQGVQLAITQIPYDVPKAELQSWTLQSMPVSENDGNMIVTLNGLRADWNKREMEQRKFSDILTVSPDYDVSIDGVKSSSWIPLTEGVPFFENTLQFRVVNAMIESQWGVFAPFDRCTVSPYECAWTVHLPLICRNPDEVAESEKITFSAVLFDTGLLGVPEDLAESKIGESTVRFLGAGRDGSFVYEASGEGTFDMTVGCPLESLTENRLQGTFQSTRTANPSGRMVSGFPIIGRVLGSAQFPMTVKLKFTALRPHIAISLVDSGDRYPFVAVKDESGRIVDGELFNVQGLIVWLAKTSCEDIQQVDVTLLLQQPRFFTFVVPPPTVPPRDMASVESEHD